MPSPPSTTEPVSQVVGVREAQRLQTRARVFDAAVAEFGRSGLAGAGVGAVGAGGGGGGGGVGRVRGGGRGRRSDSGGGGGGARHVLFPLPDQRARAGRVGASRGSENRGDARHPNRRTGRSAVAAQTASTPRPRRRGAVRPEGLQRHAGPALLRDPARRTRTG